MSGIRESGARFARDWPRRAIHLIQDLARSRELFLIACTPAGDKVMRLHAQSIKFEAGEVLLPERAPWLGTGHRKGGRRSTFGWTSPARQAWLGMAGRTGPARPAPARRTGLEVVEAPRCVWIGMEC